jgi:hypothetical protein
MAYLCIFLELLFYAAQYSLKSCPTNYSCLSITPISASAHILVDPPVLYQGLENASSLGDDEAYLVCFPAVRDHFLILPVFQYMETTIPYVMFSFIVTHGGMANSPLVILHDQEQIIPEVKFIF